MIKCLAADRKDAAAHVRLSFALVFGVLALAAGPSTATSVVPISDPELYARADVIVHGVVVSNHVGEDALGRPETVTSIAPLAVLKGQLAGELVLHQLGGTLPDGRFFKLWGRPEYTVGREVIVFAIARPEGDYQTAELLLGKFEIQQDERGSSFAVPALVADDPVQVTVRRHRPNASPGNLKATRIDDVLAPRDLDGFLLSLRSPQAVAPSVWLPPRGTLTPVVHVEYQPRGVAPKWVAIGANWRWNNGATAVFTLDGQANITGGGIAEATGAAQTWDAEPNSTINYTIGTGSANPIHLNALSSPCGWSTCMSTGGVIGCGGPGGSGTNTWRGETYVTITNGEVWLRAYCTANFFDPVTTQSVLTHELGHTLGLGHSDQGVSAHDTCGGDESPATMRSSVQHRTTLGADDADAVRWIYGDGGNSCGGGGMMLTVTKIGGGNGTVTGVPAGISCGTACSSTSASYTSGTVVTLSAVAATNSVFTGWGGDADCADGILTMSAARNCSANFSLLPDLLVSSLTVPSSATAGSVISISETTKNQGGATAVSTTRYYLSTTSTYDASDTALGFRAIPRTGIREHELRDRAVDAPVRPGGGQLLHPRARRRRRPDRGVERNQQHDGERDVDRRTRPRRLDALAGRDERRGAHHHDQRYHAQSIDDGSGCFLGDALLPFDRHHGCTRGRCDRLPRCPGAAAGSLEFRLDAAADPGRDHGRNVLHHRQGQRRGHSVRRDQFTNNTRSSSIVIGPDMVVSSLTVPATSGAGLPITVTDTTKNQGAGSSARVTTTSFYLSVNTTIGVGDTLLGSRSVGILGPAGTDSVSTTLTIPPGTTPGTYYIVAVAMTATRYRRQSRRTIRVRRSSS